MKKAQKIQFIVGTDKEMQIKMVKAIDSLVEAVEELQVDYAKRLQDYREILYNYQDQPEFKRPLTFNDRAPLDELVEISKPEKRYTVSELREKYQEWDITNEKIPFVKTVNEQFMDWLEQEDNARS